MSQEKLDGPGYNHSGVSGIGVHLAHDAFCLIELAEGLVGVYFSHDRSIVARSDIQCSIDELERHLKLAHGTVGIGGPHQGLEVARVELDRLMKTRHALIPTTLAAGNQRE